jgi:hypothetical protein
MEERRPGRLEPIPPIQLGLLAVAIVVLAVVVGSASRPGDAGPVSSPGSPEAAAAILRAGVILFVIFEAGVLALVAWALWPSHRRRPVRGGEFRWLLALGSFLQTAAAVVVIWLYLHYRSPFGARGSGIFAALGLRTPGLSLPDRSPVAGGGQDWLTALIVGAVLVIALALLLRLALRGRGRGRTPLQHLAEQLQEAFEEGLQELEAEPDPRRAVIAAYARMERSLARVGMPRQPSETGLEYLQRLFAMLHLAGSAAGRLTSLFQLAKFSDHPVDEAMKQEAIAALGELRDELGALTSDGERAAVPA